MKQSEGAPVGVAILSYDKKSGIQAIGNMAPDPPL